MKNLFLAVVLMFGCLFSAMPTMAQTEDV